MSFPTQKGDFLRVFAYILKPVNPEEFEKVVGEINEKLQRVSVRKNGRTKVWEFLREHLLYLMVNGQSHNAMQEKTQTLLDMSFVRDFLPYGTAGVCQQLF